MLIAISTLAILMCLVGLVLGIAGHKLRNDGNTVANQIEDLLPQTQCAQCTFPGCRPYAEAIASGEADINQCPPGGQQTIDALAKLPGRESKPLNPDNGEIGTPLVAIIHEDLCIGCKKCILACPVDAILGAAKTMHTVIASECTGCELCVEPCPVDCIDMVAPGLHPASWTRPFPIPVVLAR